MDKFGLVVVALLTVLCGALGWAVIALPFPGAPSGAQSSARASGPDASSLASQSPASSGPTNPGGTTEPAPPVDPGDPVVTVPTVPVADASVQSQASAEAAPSQVSVTSLGVDVPVIPVGLDDAGNMELPADPAVAGWYKYGPAPESAAGATVVAAHVDSLTYGLGPFAALADAEPGTLIVVTDVTGAARTYAVSSIETTGKGEVLWADVFDRTGRPRLILVTCGGEFDYSTRHYLSNVIIMATPVG
jgi:sortase (surface protein transpeptidase)